MFQKALDLATKLHKGQVDKGGNPYIQHPIAVANLVKTEEEKCVAILHDTIEDCGIDAAFLKTEGFPESIINAVVLLSKVEGQTLDEYLIAIKSNELATSVKLADLTHNSNISRIPNPTERDFKRLDKYKRCIEFLKS